MSRSSLWFVCFLLLHLCSFLLPAASEPATVQSTGPAVFLHDGTIIRNVSLVASLELATKYGKVTIPVRDVKWLQVGLRVTKEESREIGRLVRQLRSDELKDREAASRLLGEKGWRAWPAIQKEAASGALPPQTANRLQTLLRALPPLDLQPRPGAEDVITTADCTFVGRLAGDSIKVRSKLLGEKELKLADVLLIDQGGGAASPAAPVRACSLQEIAQLSRAGVTDAVIINQIRTSGTVPCPSADEILYLKRNGVSDPVIQELQARGNGQAVPQINFDPKLLLPPEVPPDKVP